ncbi:M20 peptidase aminoacylase family protein [Paenibacillus macquariensis]|uniref:Amidohydrolase n=1 Tax=Paenibacillus macquariensis TaxID=948756 RepID=A0ABY1KA24_9BACL|nr:M20 peptidase aminoacylase family protein [Paenibacillus macquariensis]MEC0092359.1 M20 peptidase aminoacylase family protein [Paenibacillus macquariensis]OAB35335.1 hydrolase [Paenibacillus macquariensis subsp. macquariensis]SIR48443.1 amidohydrolase [Paenibacillus macquariensis]
MLEQQLIEIRRHLHSKPELSHEEFETTKSIRGWLEEAGIRIADYSLTTGIIAEVGGYHGGPIVAVRADIDALAIQEDTGLSYASLIPGKMHACGHDFHTASILGTALLLKRREHELKGTVRFIFQPAEEKAKGANQVIASGALKGVWAIFGMHNKPDLPTGTIGIKSGALMAAADGFAVEVKGIGTHAAVPEAGVDPIVVASHMVTALQSIVSRNIGSLQSAVISVTRIHSGTAWNVISESAMLDGTIRTFDIEVRNHVLKRFQQIIDGVASAFGTTANVRWLPGPPSVHNDASLESLAIEAAESVGLHVVTAIPSPAGEDFAFYQQEIPGFFVFMGTSGPQEWHHPAFDVDERALSISAEYFADLSQRAINQLLIKE